MLQLGNKLETSLIYRKSTELFELVPWVSEQEDPLPTPSCQLWRDPRPPAAAATPRHPLPLASRARPTGRWLSLFRSASREAKRNPLHFGGFGGTSYFLCVVYLGTL